MSIRCVHLDLKGLPPTASRLLKLLQLFADAGFNAVLVEWEDAFPWTIHSDFRSPTAYNLEQISAFHERARSLGLEIIPLVQCLGHMETPLSVPEYFSLREDQHFCDCLHPLAPGSRVLVERMVNEVLTQSRPVRYFHLGGDEAFALGNHPASADYIARHGKAALYMQYVEPLLDVLIAQGIRPILWHDMMHDWSETELQRLREKADLMAWGYHGHPDRASGHYATPVIERFKKAGMTLWGATAYKGADSYGSGDVPNLSKRIENALAWRELADRYDFAGVVATGWSRYTAHRVQCEPIEGALDALMQVGAILRDGKTLPDNGEGILRRLGEWERFQKCQATLSLLASSRVLFWTIQSLIREQLVNERLDPRHRGSMAIQILYRNALSHLKDAQRAADDLKKHLDQRVPAIWIVRYIDERLIPMTEALKSVLGEIGHALAPGVETFSPPN